MMTWGDIPVEMIESVIEVLRECYKDEAGIKTHIDQEFVVFDYNKDGFIQLNEFTEMLKKFYIAHKLPVLSPEQVREWFVEVDTNHDQKLSHEELVPVIKQLILLNIAQLEKKLETS